MAAADAAETAPGAAEGAVLTHRFNEILTAGGVESTARADERADAELITANRCDEQSARSSLQLMPAPAHALCLLAKLSRQPLGQIA